MMEIELEEPQTSTCECCGGTTTRLTRFVYQDGDAFAVYYAMYSDNHSDNAVTGVISIGDWDSDNVPQNRVAFPFVLWQDENSYKVSLMDKQESPWHDVEILGKMLDREEALDHPWLEDVFHITDHIAEDDFEVVNFMKMDSAMVN